jgi:hypothetical protein
MPVASGSPSSPAASQVEPKGLHQKRFTIYHTKTYHVRWVPQPTWEAADDVSRELQAGHRGQERVAHALELCVFAAVWVLGFRVLGRFHGEGGERR